MGSFERELFYSNPSSGASTGIDYKHVNVFVRENTENPLQTEEYGMDTCQEQVSLTTDSRDSETDYETSMSTNSTNTSQQKESRGLKSDINSTNKTHSPCQQTSLDSFLNKFKNVCENNDILNRLLCNEKRH